MTTLVAPPRRASAPSVDERPTRRSPWAERRAGKALLVVLWAYPLLWLLGVNAFSWAALAVIAALALIDRRERLRVPPWSGLWLLFLGWAVASAVMISDAGRMEAALYRGSTYVAAPLLLVLVLNGRCRELGARALTRGMTALWAWCIVLSVVGLVLPRLAFTSPVEVLLPASIADVPFVHALVHPQFATIDPLLDIVRPRPMFPYTNNWGSAVGLLTPVAVYTMLQARTRRARLLLGAALVVSVVPVIISINRGLWISIGLAVVYVLVRLMARGRRWALAALVGAVVATAVALVATPLGTVVTERLHASNTSTRQTLYQAAVAAVEKSPLLGYGSPISSEGLFDSNGVSIGTHGQFWTVLVSQGIPGTVLFVGFLLALILVTWRVSDRVLWLHSVLVVLVVQLFFYDPLPAGLCVAFICGALCLRDVTGLRDLAARRGRPSSDHRPPLQRVTPAGRLSARHG